MTDVVACMACLDYVALFYRVRSELDLLASHVIIVLLLFGKRLLMLHLG